MALQLTMTCGPYDRARALIDGTVKPKDIELKITVNSNDASRQEQSRERKFDIVEFYTGMYITDLPYRTFGFTAIPIFVKRMFRHSYIYINKRKGIRTASDLNGKRIGVQAWTNTTSLWARGILEDDYDLDIRSVTWIANKQDSVGDWKPPAWLRLDRRKQRHPPEISRAGARAAVRVPADETVSAAKRCRNARHHYGI